MIKYVSFLRGINVGGHRIIKMSVLKEIFESLEYEDVKTFIQSGNVLFRSPSKNKIKLNNQIEDYLSKSVGFKVETFTRTITELESVIKNNPFKIEPDKVIKLYVSFLSSEPSDENKETLKKLSYDAESFVIIGTELYSLIKKDKIAGKTLFTNNLIEKKLALSSTTRDWNTLNKILGIS